MSHPYHQAGFTKLPLLAFTQLPLLSDLILHKPLTGQELAEANSHLGLCVHCAGLQDAMVLLPPREHG